MLDYGSPTKIHHIILMERIQKDFNKHIKVFSSFFHWERLSTLKIYSLQHRTERYIIIYVWKKLENQVPNLVKQIQFYVSDRRGCLFSVSDVSLGHTGTLAYSRFRWKGIRMIMFIANAHQKYHCMCHWVFKKQLYLHHHLFGTASIQPKLSR